MGYAYFSGLALGGLVGCVSGLRSAPNRHARIVLNSVLNGSGRYGARAGNAAGILAMVYTVAGELHLFLAALSALRAVALLRCFPPVRPSLSSSLPCPALPCPCALFLFPAPCRAPG